MKKIVLVVTLLVLGACNSASTRFSKSSPKLSAHYQFEENSYVHKITGYRLSVNVGGWRLIKPPLHKAGSANSCVEYIYRRAVMTVCLMPYRSNPTLGMKEFIMARRSSERALKRIGTIVGTMNGVVEVHLSRISLTGYFKWIAYYEKGWRKQFYVIVIPLEKGLIQLRVKHDHRNFADYQINIAQFIKSVLRLKYTPRFVRN